MKQDDVFLEGEGDAWFRRNRAALGEAAALRHDWPLTLIERLEALPRIRGVAELGCSNGWRLARLRALLPEARLVGVDASAEAVADGLARFPGLGLDLRQGPLASLPLDEEVDLTIVFFVLHWVDRASLARCVAEIDRVTRDGGLLVLGDFLPDYPQRRAYHHRPDEAMYTYKQDYARIFEALGSWREIARTTFDHEHPGDTVKTAASGSRCVCTVLQKSLTGFYGEPA